MAFTPCKLTPEQSKRVDVTRVGLMAACPFFAHLFYSEMREMPTLDIPTAATDGRTLFYNPEYLMTLKIPECVFVFAHEVDHFVCRDAQRMKSYDIAGDVRGTKYDQQQFNISADYVRNAGLLETGVGMMNPAWCYADDVSGEDLLEEVYARKYKKQPEGSGGAAGAGPGAGGTRYGSSSKSPKGASRDAAADAQGGAFDQLLPPAIDPVTGAADVPDEATFKEAVARAAAAAKAMGNMPARFQKMVDEILTPQIDWTQHVRMLLTGKMGSRHETWNRPNRRRLVLNPIIIMPGKRGYGAELVVIALDTSGSIYCAPKALEAFFGEVGGVISDIRPRRVLLIECDAAIGKVEEASTMDDLDYSRSQGVTGGGGTSFVPVFDYLDREAIVPDTLIYLTDLQGRFPEAAPAYPTVWCSIEAGEAPWGDTVHITV